MAGKSSKLGQKKIKVGTALDRDVYKRLKERSVKEGRPISDILQDAIVKYEQADQLEKELRLKALENLFSIRFNISKEDWKAIMEEDYYDQ